MPSWNLSKEKDVRTYNTVIPLYHRKRESGTIHMHVICLLILNLNLRINIYIYLSIQSIKFRCPLRSKGSLKNLLLAIGN